MDAALRRIEGGAHRSAQPLEAFVEFRHVSKRFGEHTALQDLHIALPRGCITALIGPSGCGKTTTLKLINRLIDPTSGEVWVGGENVAQVDPVQLRRRIGYVIQQIGLFPHMTVEENVMLVPRLNGVPKPVARRRAEELLALVGLDPALYRHRYPRELSGGQQQRVGVARALAADPELILMDEPFSALDPISREQLQDELVRLQQSVRKTIVFVTHDMDEALKIADLIVLMRQGEVVQMDAPEDLLRHPKDDFVREFIGEKRMRQWLPGETVGEVMVRAVTLRADLGLAQAIRHMQRQRVNGLVVTDAGGEYLGVVGATEVVQHFGESSLRLRDLMTPVDPVTPDDDVLRILPRLQREGFGFLPVVAADGRVVGVLTRGGVIDAMLRRRNAVAGGSPAAARAEGAAAIAAGEGGAR